MAKPRKQKEIRTFVPYFFEPKNGEIFAVEGEEGLFVAERVDEETNSCDQCELNNESYDACELFRCKSFQRKDKKDVRIKRVEKE